MAIKTLAELRDEFEASRDDAISGSHVEEIFTALMSLTETLLAIAPPPAPDLQKKIDALQSLLDNDARTFQAIKLALGNPNLTQGQLAQEISANWKHI